MEAPYTREHSARSLSGRIDSVSNLIVIALVFLLPVFFIPSSLFSIPLTKGLLLSLAVVFSLIFWTVGRLKSGALSFPRTSIFLGALLVPLAYFVSALFSGSPKYSLLGYGAEVDTFVTITILFALMALISLVFKTREAMVKLYGALFAGYVIVALFVLVRVIFGADVLDFGLFGAAKVANMVGSWNDFGVLSGLAALLSLTTLEFLPVRRKVKLLLSFSLAISLLFLAFVNFTLIWIILGLLSLMFFVYTVTFGKNALQMEEDTSDHFKISYPSLIVLVISLVFVLGNAALGNVIASRLGISHTDVRPSWSATLSVMSDTLKESPIFGAGPNNFTYQWQASKPSGVNDTLFWDTDFGSGIGLIPSMVITTGLLGLLGWLIFFAFFLGAGFKSLAYSIKSDLLTQYLIISSFMGSLFLWVISILYVPNLVVFALAFILTGVFIASAYNAGYFEVHNISFIKNPRAGFVFVLFAVVLLILGAVWGYFASERFVASVYYQEGVAAASEGKLDDAGAHVAQAIQLAPTDFYYRSLSQINLARLNQLGTQNNASEELLRSQFQTLLGSAIQSAQAAIQLQPRNYQNWVALAGVYESLIPLKIENSYEYARDNYKEAEKRNPTSPAIVLAEARLELEAGNAEQARTLIGNSLTMKHNYTEAVFLLAQLEASEGNLDEAINSIEAATVLAPNDPTIFFQLGLLRYNVPDYTGAASAFEQAIALVPTYANAKYFLGLTYEKLGRHSDAIKQFQELTKLVPDNTEIQTVLANLNAGRDPLAGLTDQTSTTSPAEDTLPIEE